MTDPPLTPALNQFSDDEDEHISDEQLDYSVEINSQPDESLGTNRVCTSSYTWWNFVPLNLFQQFKRYYNVYFLIAAILGLIPSISPINPYANLIPLLIVVFLTFIKDGYADVKRHRADRAVNDRPVKICREGVWKTVPSHSVRAGDLLAIERDDKIMADCVLLAVSASDDARNDGGCFLETADLDGESNIKRREVPPLLRDTVHHVRTDDDEALFSSFKGTIECEPPNDRIHAFLGRLRFHPNCLSGNSQTSPVFSSSRSPDSLTSPRTLRSIPDHEVTIPLAYQHFLPRAATLKSTKLAIAAVVYVGQNTKVFRNLKKKRRPKVSSLTHILNTVTLIIFTVNFVALALATLFGGLYLRRRGQFSDYIFPTDDPSIQTVSLQQLAAYYILFQYMVPISLFISIELARLALALFMQWDTQMAGKPQKTHDGETEALLKSDDEDLIFCQVKNFNVHEDLARVKYLFCDKTGTLTQNIMNVKYWGILNGDSVTLLDQQKEQEEGGPLQTTNLPADILSSFCQSVALCHTVLPTEENGTVRYEGQSPDEVAIVKALLPNGIILSKRTKRKIIIDTTLFPSEFSVLQVLEFTSERKRMSVIVKRRQDNRIYLISKGADSVMLKGDDAMQRQVDALSSEGLRVLVVGQRELSEEEWHRFKTRYEEAEKAINGRESRLRNECDRLEKNIPVIGLIGIEDKLQDRVPETLAFLRHAGIRIWLLTGDKLETAVNIGISSKLIAKEMTIVQLGAIQRSVEAYWAAITKLLATLHPETAIDNSVSDSESLSVAEAQILESLPRDSFSVVALVIDGSVLDAAMQYSSQLFIVLSLRCACVLVCRASPLQKSQAIDMIQVSSPSVITLAIGDGANDVAMIERAHIGVGIVGREGGQAARASDYAISEFRHLARLVAVHDRFAYLRLSKLILISIYKNFTLAMVSFWFGTISGWSAQTIYDSIFLLLYNVLFTSIGPMAIAFFEKDTSERHLLTYPQLYRDLDSTRGYFSFGKVFRVIITALLHSLIIFFIMDGVFAGTDVSNTNGKVGGLALMQTYISTATFFAVTCRVLLINRYRNVFLFLAYGISAVLFLMNFLLFHLGEYLLNNAGLIALQLPSFYLSVILVTLACSLPEYAVKYYRKQYHPSDADILHEYDVLIDRPNRKKQMNK